MQSALDSAVARAVRSTRWKGLPGPGALLDEWAQVVQWCVEGYPMGFIEYRHDLEVRDVLGEIAAPTDETVPEDFAAFLARLREIDDRFRALLTPYDEVPADRPWWRRGVPRYGDEEYVEGAAVVGLSLELRSPD